MMLHLKINTRVPIFVRHHRRHFKVRADNNDEPKEQLSTQERFTEQLKRQGFDKESAQKILDVWKEAGADDPDQLRKLFVRGSIRPLAVVFLQLVLDAGAAYGCFVFGATISALPGIPLPIFFSLLGTFAGFYFVSSSAIDIVTLGTIIWSIYKFGTNTDAFLQALQSIAGARGGDYNVIEKAKKIVDAFKVINALNEISGVLKERGTGEISTLENLSAFLTLSYAENQYGFKPSKYGLTEEEAARIAVVFSRYDRNDDGVLQTSELGSLVSELGTPLNEDETSAAMKVVDTDSSGVIEFEEFVDWWVNEIRPERAKEIEP